MLASVPKNILLFLLGLFLGIAALVLVGGVVWAIRRMRKIKGKGAKKYILFNFASVLVVAASWVLNFGWLRFFLTILLIPILHGLIYFVFNFYAFAYLEQSSKMKRYNMLFILTYLLTYLLLPDGGDVGEMYFFFGLIHNQILSGITYALSRVAFIAHIVFFVLQIVERIKIKKRKAVIPGAEDEAGI